MSHLRLSESRIPDETNRFSRPRGTPWRRWIVFLSVWVIGWSLTAPATATAQGVCDRTPQVRDRLVEAAGVSSCEDVTPEHLAAVTLLDLSESGIGTLQAHDFRDLGRLQRLRLYGNSLTILPPSLFHGLARLERLALNSNQLRELPPGLFRGLGSLERLWLYRNQLETLPDGIFSGLAELTYLTLAENSLTNLPPGLFTGLSKLESLSLLRNSLSSLPDGVFGDLSSLNQLWLQENSLATLPEGVFRGLVSLRTLKLDRNLLTALPDGIFHGLGLLRTLSLDHNLLNALGGGTFLGLNLLQRLTLDSNSLRELPEEVFGGLSSLFELQLRQNRLQTLPEGIFSGLSRLQILTLDGNSLRVLPEGVFDGLSQLVQLPLQGNDLRTLPEEIFSGLSGLKRLTLNQNSLRELPAGVFRRLRRLRDLALEDNHLAALPEGVFDQNLATLGAVQDSPGLRLDAALKAEPAFAFPAGTAAPGAAATATVTLHRPLPVAVRLPYAVGGTASSADYADLSPAPEEGLLFPAGETRRQISLTILAGADKLGKTLVLTLGGLSEIGLRRSDGTGPDAPFLPAETLLSLSPDGAAHTLTVANPDPGSTTGGICDRTPQVRDKLLEATGVSACGQVTPGQLASVTLLNLRRTGIHALQAQDFNGLSSLTGLSLGENRLTTLPVGIFTGLSSLERLEMPGNALSTLPEGVFAELSSLTWLDLGSNALSALPEGIFSGLANLETLWMNGNSLTELPEAVFQDLSRLADLNLGFNSLTALPEGIFDGLSALQALKMHENSLMELPGGLFLEVSDPEAFIPIDLPRQAAKLGSLWLQGNRLRTLPQDVFQGLGNLRVLLLDRNSLIALPEGVFGELSHLEALFLSDNSIASLPEGIFQGLSRLEQLELDRNRLTLLPEAVFSGLSHLEWLNLSVNSLSALAPGIFQGLTRLEELRLDGNRLAALPPGLLDDTLSELGIGPENQGLHVDATLKARLGFAPAAQTAAPGTRVTATVTLHRALPVSLRVSYAVGGTATSADYADLSPAPEEGLLFPAGEIRRQIALTILAGADKLGKTLVLTLGELSEIDLRRSDGTGPKAPFLKAETLLSLSPEGATHTLTVANPDPGSTPGGICDRTAQVRDKLLEATGVTACGQVTRGQLASVTLLDLTRTGIHTLQAQDFNGLSSLTGLSLSENRLTTLPEEIFSGLSSLERLDLSANSLAALPPEIFQGLSSLEELRLDGNRLAALPPGLLDDTLSKLGIGPENQGLHVDATLKARLGFAPAAQTANPGTGVTATVTLHRALPVSLRVPYSVGGTATSADYADLSPAPEEGLLFPAGETRKEITLLLIEGTGQAGKTIVLTLGQTSEIDLLRSDGTGPKAPFLKAETLLSGSPDQATHTITLTGPADTGLNVSFIPAILSAAGMNDSFFTSEMTLTNRGPEAVALNYTYTAHLGSGSGTASEVVAAGRQKIVPDAIKHLRGLGVPIPGSGNRIGTLAVEFAADSEVGVSVRTTTAVPLGRAGLAYPGVSEEGGFQEPVYLAGLRQTPQDRSNLAFQNMGTAAEGPIRLRATVFSGDAADSHPTLLEEVTLEPGGFHQYSGVLGSLPNGFVRVEKTAGKAPFYAYGVINDQANSDGSFVLPVTAGSLVGTTGQTLPVIVESGAFTSELTVTNFSEQARTVSFAFVSEGVDTSDRTARFSMSLEAGEQRITPDLVNEMRRQGVSGIGSAGGLAGALFARVEGGDMSGIAIGARTVSQAVFAGGQYGVSYNAVPYGSAFSQVAWVEGLQQNQESRSNLTLVNSGEVDNSDSVFAIDIYDGDTGLLVTTITGRRVPARGWRQINSILRDYTEDTTQGYVRIRKISGNNPFLAYGVINDGGAPGERSGDGAYLAARE